MRYAPTFLPFIRRGALVAVVVILDNLNTLNRMEVKRMKIIVFKVRFKE